LNIFSREFVCAIVDNLIDERANHDILIEICRRFRIQGGFLQPEGMQVSYNKS
jgi:hypothetical protein